MYKILIVPKSQYGYNTDYFKMANYLAKQNVLVDILCIDQGFKRIDPPHNVNVVYVERKSKGKNIINYIKNIINYIFNRRKEYNWIIVSGTIQFCGHIPILLKKFTPKTLWIMDIRTGAVVEDEWKRNLYDSSMTWSSKFFDHITIISDLLAIKLKLDRYFLLPLGAEQIIDVSSKEVNKDQMNFIYIGTFDNRNIDNVIKAFDIFCSKFDNQIKNRFDIVGFSSNEETQQTILETIENARNKDKIIFHGRKNHDEIITLFKEATVGFSYIPITDYYNVQPPTKTFEYIMNGVICIGTNTEANAQIINEKNGLLTNDDIDSVVEGIETVFNKLSSYNSLEVSRTVEDYSWIKIEQRFYKFLRNVDLNK
ncbi:hypothetical protein CN563_10400 [Bacillus sp. AFS026049]|uniref:glycosyltransferase n=1 Tax=Peribacillus frigoritolerans TaxID=450367 RepID=UPI000BF9F92E|nr:hypothetical protein CN563_10400 [Bacillus sp. AFS026049]